MGTSPKRQRSTSARINSFKLVLVLGYAAITILSLLIVSALVISKSDTVLKNKVSTLTSALNMQMKLNMESYLDRMETIGTLAFAAEESYTYDATAPGMDEYDALATEKIITDKLFSLCIMENFVDYGIVYSNNHAVGKISNGTIAQFGDSIFESLHSMVTRRRTHDGWSAGWDGNFKRIYYVKEIHENAVLVISFYTTELEGVFDNPETMNDMVIRLTDSRYDILYSSDPADELGSPLESDIAERISGKDAATILDDDYLVTVSGCGDSWYVICSVPTKIILAEKNDMQLYIILTALIAATLAVLLGTVLSVRISDIAADLVSVLDNKAHIDQLTGIYNKRSFEDATGRALAEAQPPDVYALILLDVDNFKGVNDTLGHAYGDAVLAKIGSTLLKTFSANDYLGRIGGDEFCVFMRIMPEDVEHCEEVIMVKCEMLSEAFHSYYTGEQKDYKISCSMGVAVFPEHGTDFAGLYAAADKALYHSKHRGKDMYTFSGTFGEEDAP